MDWDTDVSKEARETMKFLGNFGPHKVLIDAIAELEQLRRRERRTVMGFQIELDLRNHNKLLLEENEQLQAKNAELTAEVERLSAAHVKACQANADSQAQLAAAQEEIERLNGQITVYRLSFVELERQRDVEMTSATRWAVRYHELRDQLAAAREEINDWRNQAHQSLSAFDRLQDQLAAAQEECEFQRNAHKQAEELMLEQSSQLAAEQLNNRLLRDALNQWIGIAANCSIESGYCSCGEPIENHSHQMTCGHSPVDMAYYVVREVIDSTDKALSIPASTEALDKYMAEKMRDIENERFNINADG